ncbi:MAG: hypothetical protein F6K11_11995 [Leptolyngbya sp. SIO3F4]|nr:hypothetical protein [Leptolyngbya sp. SIO3F4]
MGLIPKEPANERGVLARQKYLELARRVIGESQLEYGALYERFAENDWAAIKLDEAVALKGLTAGHLPKVVVGILHQSPYLQHQVHQNKVPLAPMSQYVRSTVMKVWQQIEKTSMQRSQPAKSRQINLNMEPD